MAANDPLATFDLSDSGLSNAYRALKFRLALPVTDTRVSAQTNCYAPIGIDFFHA